MKLTDLIGLLGGLGLFLYGMQMMSNGLEAAAGNRMKKILEKLTANRFLGVVVGAVITAVIQSSSATTVMVVGFVNSGMMTLQQAVWIIMGANVGTTITGQLIALDVGAIAPLFAFIGVAFIVFLKNEKLHHYGKIIAGLGILFIGMDMMSAAMVPLRESETFVNIITRLSKPVLVFLSCSIFTAIFYFSSPSLGILQALASSGVIGLPQAVYVLFGQNIGTCITAVLASIGTSRVAKRTTIIHLLFNIIGTTLFTIICILTPFTTLVEGFTPNNVSAQIANMHTIFNITTTILLIPFGTYLAKLATRILPDLPEERDDVMHLEYIQPFIPIENRGETKIGISAIAITAIRNELIRMTQMTRENVGLSFDAVHDNNLALVEDVRNREEYIDYLNKEISKYISRMLVKERNPKDSQYMSALFKVCGNLERIGDHAMNICEYTNMIKEKQITFSKEVMVQIEQMKEVCCDALDLLLDNQANSENLHSIESIEQKIDDMTESFRQGQIDRMQTGKCSDEGCVLYSEMLTDFERIGDHILNIGQEVTGSVDD